MYKSYYDEKCGLKVILLKLHKFMEVLERVINREMHSY